jgi:hypothetical protein
MRHSTKLVRLSRTSMADEMPEDYRRRVLIRCYAFRKSSGGLAMFAAILRASCDACVKMEMGRIDALVDNLAASFDHNSNSDIHARLASSYSASNSMCTASMD